jgi:hypothetical protein
MATPAVATCARVVDEGVGVDHPEVIAQQRLDDLAGQF